MPWALLKQLHVVLGILTACSFCLRGYWMLVRSPKLDAPWTRRLPHVVDALLLLTGLTMAIGLGISPLAHPWLAAKLVAIVIYVVIGSVALKRGRTYPQRALALGISVLVLLYVFAAALSHDPLVGIG
jgi:uncharacterized membrane protein SirB2